MRPSFQRSNAGRKISDEGTQRAKLLLEDNRHLGGAAQMRCYDLHFKRNPTVNDKVVGLGSNLGDAVEMYRTGGRQRACQADCA